MGVGAVSSCRFVFNVPQVNISRSLHDYDDKLRRRSALLVPASTRDNVLSLPSVEGNRVGGLVN